LTPPGLALFGGTPTGRIFVVDDEVYIQDLYQSMLPVGGHEVVDSAFNGEEAIIKFESLSRKPDLTIMDHRMPIKNGLDATREIVLRDPDARVLVISADATVQPKCKDAGAAGFLEKPFTMDVLFRTIEVALRNPPVHIEP
jgi:two-component system, chemotaxis family, chemotaxis protein CheY